MKEYKINSLIMFDSFDKVLIYLDSTAGLSVVLQWISGHRDTLANICADEAAKEAQDNEVGLELLSR